MVSVLLSDNMTILLHIDDKACIGCCPCLAMMIKTDDGTFHKFYNRNHANYPDKQIQIKYLKGKEKNIRAKH